MAPSWLPPGSLLPPSLLPPGFRLLACRAIKAPDELPAGLQVDRMTAHAAELDAELDRVRAGLGNARRTSEAVAQELKAQLDRACAAQGAAQQRAALGDEKVCELQAQLEEALQSSVRLCVVAPTVNVTFGGQSLSSKAPLPKDKIRTALETQVLPNFTRCFIQPDESLGPEGGSMDDWLKNVTSSMQGSIEKHLTKVRPQPRRSSCHALQPPHATAPLRRCS